MVFLEYDIIIVRLLLSKLLVWVIKKWLIDKLFNNYLVDLYGVYVNSIILKFKD